MDRYFKMVVPFATKPYIREKKNGLIVVGEANYIYDREKNKFVDWYIEIEKSNYRITDVKMLKPTEYYMKDIVKNFRTNFLDKYSGINLSDQTLYKFLSSEQINDVNKELRRMKTTIRTMFSLLSGSNISGSELDHRASPIRCIDNKYFYCNFANPINKFIVNSKYKETILLKMNTYSLDYVLEKNIIPGFKDEFDKYNEEWLYKDFKPGIDYTSEDNHNFSKYNINDYFKISEKQEDYIYAILNNKIYNHDNISKMDLKNKLRSFFTLNVKNYINDKKIPIMSTTENYTLDTIKNAHIIPFSDLFNELTYSSLKDAINPYNCLRIDGNTHDRFDKKKILFLKDGSITDREGNLIKEKYLDINNMPLETKKFFNRIAK